jgi:hypothetical protein
MASAALPAQHAGVAGARRVRGRAARPGAEAAYLTHAHARGELDLGRAQDVFVNHANPELPVPIVAARVQRSELADKERVATSSTRLRDAHTVLDEAGDTRGEEDVVAMALPERSAVAPSPRPRPPIRGQRQALEPSSHDLHDAAEWRLAHLGASEASGLSGALDAARLGAADEAAVAKTPVLACAA